MCWDVFADVVVDVGWFVLLLVGVVPVPPVLAGVVSGAVVGVNVIFVGELSVGEVLVGAVLAPLEPPEAGPLPGPVSPVFVPDGLFGSFRNWVGPVGPVGAVPMLAPVAPPIPPTPPNAAHPLAP